MFDNNQYIDPDYPTTVGSFLQHTYKAQESMYNNADSFYYGGAMNPFGGGTAPGFAGTDSRRNMAPGMTPGMMPQQAPVQSPYGYGYGQPINVPQNTQSELRPFSSYPPSGPAAMPAFNSMVDSRRNVQSTVPTGTNPWVTQNNQIQQQPLNMPGYNPMTNGMGSPYSNPYSGYYSETATQSLYSNPVPGFDKNTPAWDYSRTNNNYIAPAVNWSQPTTPPVMNTQYAFSGVSYPTTQRSWKEIAELNWG